MSVRLHLDVLLHRRRMSLSELSDRVGISPSNLALLKLGQARALRFSTLEAICRELECQPGDLLTYEAGDTNGEQP